LAADREGGTEWNTEPTLPVVDPASGEGSDGAARGFDKDGARWNTGLTLLVVERANEVGSGGAAESIDIEIDLRACGLAWNQE
jgi:hypothetical protein